MAQFLMFTKRPVAVWARYFRNHGCVWIFQHIPKTAGSSLTREMACALAPYRNVFAQTDRNASSHPHEAMMGAVGEFLEAQQTTHYASASGHFRNAHVERITKALPHARTFTFLRDPAERFISDYRYAKTPKHPPHEEFAKRYPTIEAYVEDPQQHNKMWRFVSPNQRACNEQTLRETFRRYAFFGLTRSLSEHFAFLTGLTTCPRYASARVNVTRAQDDNAVTIPSQLRSRIEEANADDYAFYAGVEAALNKKTAEMREFIAERRAYFLGNAAPMHR